MVGRAESALVKNCKRKEAEPPPLHSRPQFLWLRLPFLSQPTHPHSGDSHQLVSGANGRATCSCVAALDQLSYTHAFRETTHALDKPTEKGNRKKKKKEGVGVSHE